jgi:hypothetical protein
MFLRVLAGLLCVFGIGAQDVIGSTGCSAPNCVFANANLRFGTGSENSVNAQGLFVQPWYFSRTGNAWYKLTFSNYPLDTAIGSGNTSAHWSKTTIVDLYSLIPSNSFTNYSEFIVDSSDTTKSVGHGKIVATRSVSLLGQPIIFQNTFSLGRNDSFVKIVTRVINNASTPLINLMIWTGTRDDFVGTTDVNTKTRGNLDTGSFVAVTTNNQSSRAIMITNTNEGVLFYSETSGVMTSYDMCCSFANAYNRYPLSLAPMTLSPTDGSYAAVLPIGDVDVNSSGSITWYYAAGAVTSLSAVAQTVAAAQVADAPPSATSSVTATPSVSATPSGSGTVTPSLSATPSESGTVTPSVSATPSESGTVTPSETGSVTPSVSATPSETGTVTLSETGTVTPSETGTPTPSSTRTPTGTGTDTVTLSVSGTGTDTVTLSVSGTGTFTGSETALITKSRTPAPAPAPSPLAEVVIRVQTADQVPNNMLYLYIFVPLNIIFCLCCSVGVILAIVYTRRRKEKKWDKDEITLVNEVNEA